MSIPENPNIQSSHIKNYYKFQSRIYDATRWSFLFGRDELIRNLPYKRSDHFKVLEVGCGTGHILSNLAKHYPSAEIHGLDISSDMLGKAEKRLQPYHYRTKLHNTNFTEKASIPQSFDLIIFAYTLTMINPQWQHFIELSKTFLNPKGKIAVVDFHDTRLLPYKKFMEFNHVNLNGHLLPYLQTEFSQDLQGVNNGILGIWRYFTFIGQR